MSDDADRASEYETMERAHAITQAARSMAKRSAVSLTHCLECGEKIPDKRRQAEPGCELCVQCKAGMEKKGGFWV
ncbi:MAG: TraR/DksA C4-type zinc finger protein [Proteobacteria bacterium]|nr:TraR/DksA C4-type zinc finger protein [Pseudomonadota bacterium]